MSSSPPSEPRPSSALDRVRDLGGRLRGRVTPLHSWTLRSKLVASMLVLFAVLSLATGAFTVLALRAQLTSQVDDQLVGSKQRLLLERRPLDFTGGDDTEGPRGPGDEGLLAFVPSAPTQAFPTAAGKVAAGSRAEASLTSAQLQELADADLSQGPRSIELPELGTYRVLAFPSQLSGGGETTEGVLVIGLSMELSEHTVRQMALGAVGTVGTGIALVALLGTWLVRRNLEPLRRVAATATRVAQLPLHSGQVALAERVPAEYTDTRTEVGQVGAAFNEMLDHVDEALNARHQSEQRVRQFVADASHELRTPLASIKGYAELTRREREPMPTSVNHAMDRIESEAGRMSALVEDLLLLARLDAGRPLDRTPVDLSMLVVDAVSDAHAAAPDHKWSLDLPPEPIEVTGDRARLHQIVVNLLGNARTHTPPGTTVTTSVRSEGDTVRIAVHDNGPGVSDDLRTKVFERFARGDDARNRSGGSTGLGLSIVSAVTKAHGGRVELESSPGDTTFSLVLPAGPAPQPA